MSRGLAILGSRTRVEWVESLENNYRTPQNRFWSKLYEEKNYPIFDENVVANYPNLSGFHVFELDV